MATIPLNQPLDDVALNSPEKAFLKNLQANILKGHGREHVALVFLAIRDVAGARSFLRHYPVYDALTQLQDAIAFKTQQKPGGAVRLVFLSQAGLTTLGHGPKFAPFGAFAGGMAADHAVLDGGSTAGWQPELKKQAHVLLLLAHHDEAEFARLVGAQVDELGKATSPLEVLFVQEGRAYKNGDGEGVEHFGYVDGRSQPLMLKTAIDDELHTVYDPTAPLDQFILPDPLQAGGLGSFFVFRKLEQNVAGFKQAEQALAKALALQGADRERAGAQVVGRFENGTPVTLADAEESVPVRNDFDYGADATGGKCPFHGHIRKTNPRGASPGGKAFDKTVQMARRGITYGVRLQDPDSKEFIDQPNDGVGLLFMSYQASIEKQFQFMQVSWANNPNFPSPGVGIDPVIGQGASVDQNWPPTYGSTAGSKPHLFKGFVTLKGGEYFYTPSLPGLKNI